MGMSDRKAPDGRAEILQGTLDLMVLRSLETMGPQHGYAVAARIEQVSDGAIHLNMGTLYPALLRLEQRGYVRARWDTTGSNRRARYYSITASGRQQLEVEKAGWERMAGIIRRMLHEKP
jgi:transcriptional regulator